VPGAASHSYGIHVARLAGLPAAVIERAKEILAKLEGDESDRENLRKETAPSVAAEPVQMALFGSADRKLREELKRVDVARLTPMEAINLLDKLSEEAKK
jgi:DNA mismatch repair protein MutS